MHTPPTLSYSGVTLIVDSPSRFDLEFGRLCSGPVVPWMNQEVLSPTHPLDSFDLRDSNVTAPFLPNTRKVILAGKNVATKYRATYDPPGYPTIVNGIPAISIFPPQECCDYKTISSSVSEDQLAPTDRETKDASPTLPRNKRFWTKWHIAKFLSSSRPPLPKLDERVYPNLDVVIKILESTTDSLIYLDIETSRAHRGIICLGFTTTELFPTVYVVPFYRYSGELAYPHDSFLRFHRAFSLALSRNTAVIHNSGFDLIVLHVYYKFCLPRDVYDTMIATHRINLEAEKSLGHTISCWTDLPYHKDQITDPRSSQEERILWTYNARDVYSMVPIMKSQLAYAANDRGLLASIAQGNASILPMLDTTIGGLRLNLLSLTNRQIVLRRHQALYQHIAEILSGVPGFNPASPKQCIDFFHKKLGYDIQSRTATGSAALGSKQLYQLQLKYHNPLIPVIIKYREVAKDASSLESELFTIP